MTATMHPTLREGIQPAQAVRALAESRAIAPATPFAPDRIYRAVLEALAPEPEA